MTNFWTEFREGLSISFHALLANKMRAVLTTVGIVIGVLSVTLMATAIEGLDRAFNDSISKMGADVYYVQKWPFVVGDDWWKYKNRKEVRENEAKALERNMTLASYISPFIGNIGTVKYRGVSLTGVFYVGSNEHYLHISSTGDMYTGRFFTQAESDGERPVVVLGYEVMEKLFPHDDPIGKTLIVNGRGFRVTGVLDKQGSFLGLFSFDNRVVIPYGQARRMMGPNSGVQIGVKVKALSLMGDAEEEIRGIMRKIRHVPPGKEDDFAINQQDILTSAFNSITTTIATIGLFLTGLSLFVGGIGIMNIMFVSVTERTKEIGLRKAMGARNRTILTQFLMESTTICLLGGFIGVFIAIPLSFVIDQILPTSMPVSIIIYAFVISLVVGVISGFLPAYRAARMNPVDALRSE